MSRRVERGDIVLTWLAKIVVGLAVVGVLGIDGFSLLAAQISAGDSARAAAQAGSDAWEQTKNQEFAATSAKDAAAESGGTIPANGMKIFPDGKVTVVVKKTATTLVVHRISKIRFLEVATGHGTARPV